MRIIGGRARGTNILAPAGMDTRPTLDRVRENVFNILQKRIPGARVLDLFAGSGAMGFEALSRGADSACLVDHSKDAVKVIEQNCTKLRMNDQCRILQSDWTRAVTGFQAAGQVFDVIFLDPPYAMIDLQVLSRALLPVLAEGGVMVLEHRASTMPRVCDGLDLTDSRRYGIAGVCFFERTKDE